MEALGAVGVGLAILVETVVPPVPVINESAVSVTLTSREPAVRKTAEKVFCPSSAPLKVYADGRPACGSVLVKATVPA